MIFHRTLGCLTVAAIALVTDVAGADTLKVRAGVIPVLGAAPLFVAQHEGWLKAAGLDVNIVTFESGPNIIQAAASGGIDVYVAGIAPTALARTKGIDFRVVAATAVDENVLAATGKLHAFFKKGVAPAAAFRQFHAELGRPAKIATQPPGSVPAANLRYWLDEVAHADPADVQIVSIGIDATQQALLAGAVDAATVREPTLTIIQQRNPSVGLLATGEELFPGQPGTVLALYGPFLDRHPEAAQAIVDAVTRAIDKLRTDPDSAIPAIQSALSKGIVDVATIKRSLGSPAVHFVSDPNTIIGPTKAMLDYQVKIHALSKAPDVAKLFDTSLYAKTKSGAQP